MLKVTTLPLLEVLVIVNAFVVPVPPGRPSMVTYIALLRLMVVPMKLLLICRLVAPLSGLKIIFFEEDIQGMFPKERGKVSAVLV